MSHPIGVLRFGYPLLHPTQRRVLAEAFFGQNIMFLLGSCQGEEKLLKLPAQTRAPCLKWCLFPMRNVDN